MAINDATYAKGITFQGSHTKKETYKGFSNRDRAIVDLIQEATDGAELDNYTFGADIKTLAGLTATVGGMTGSAGGLTVTAGQTAFRGTIRTRYQPAEATTADSTAEVTAANILTGIVKCTPTGDHTKPVDSAEDLISTLGLSENSDSFDFSVINLATDGASHLTLSGSYPASGQGVNILGCAVVSAQDLAQDAFTSGVGRFRVTRATATRVTMSRIG